jgi:hypothetical protein
MSCRSPLVADRAVFRSTTGLGEVASVITAAIRIDAASAANIFNMVTSGCFPGTIAIRPLVLDARKGLVASRFVCDHPEAVIAGAILALRPLALRPVDSVFAKNECVRVANQFPILG